MNKRTIMLVCNAGMSTSMLVTNMKKVAERDNKDYEIFSVSTNDVSDKISEQKIDVVLLGPQVRYMISTVQDQAGDIPVEVIDMLDYGTMNGENVLKQAEKLFD